MSENKPTTEEIRRAQQTNDPLELVLQALYGIGLGAQTAKLMLERDPSAARAALDYLLSLTDTALNEMRALTTQHRTSPIQ